MTYPRPSRRSPSTLRPLSAELSPLHQADGSASLKAGNTHVMVAIYGPVAPRISHRERVDQGLVSVVFSKGVMMAGSGGAVSIDDSANGETMRQLATPLPSGGGATERELESFLSDALSSCIILERYPRCVIQVVVQIVQADGSVLGTAVNCAVMALMDAGVAMRGLPVATTCVFVGKRQRQDESRIWIDPTAEEESSENHSIVVFVTEAETKEEDDDIPSDVVTSFTFGAPLSTSGLIQCTESINEHNTAMVAFMRMAVEQKVQKEVETLWS